MKQNYLTCCDSDFKIWNSGIQVRVMTDKRAKRTFENVQIVRLNALVNIVRLFVKLFIWIGLFFFIWLSIKELAGQTTIINAVVNYVSSSTASLVQFLVIVVLLIWGIIERVLRHRTTEKMRSHIKKLETKFDSERTPSSLTPTSKTNPEDIRE